MESTCSSPNLTRNNKKSLSAMVHDILLDQICSQQLSPGTSLKRRDVAASLGVSYAPVVEAFVQLELEGFLVTIPRKGTVVRSFGIESIRENLFLREALECEAARLYCGQPVIDHFDHLLCLGEKIDATFSQENPKNWKLEYAFHSELVALSDCPLLLQEFNRTMKLDLFYDIYNFVFTNGHSYPMLDKHSSLLEKLKTKNPDEAEKAIRFHLGTSIFMVLKNYKDKKNNQE